jgi:hypothetical protein
MAECPDLPLEALAAIENEREYISSRLRYKYRLLFDGSYELATSTPFHPKPANLKLELQDYAAALFDAEAEQYPKYAKSENQISLWLGALTLRTTSEISEKLKEHAAYHDRHCPASERLQAMETKLSKRVEYWVRVYSARVARNKKRPVVPPEEAITPERSDNEVARRAKLLSEYKNSTGNPSNRRIYTAKTSGIHKPQFYSWLDGSLPVTSKTCVNFERFLRQKKPPIPRTPKG